MTVNILDYMPFADTLGIELVDAQKDRVVARLTVDKSICTTGKIMHGGAIMAFADTLGAIGAFLNLPEGAKSTTTIESKTNFLGPAPMGGEVIGECTPVHVGRRTSVWQTRISRADGKQVALVTQSQMVLT
ncbi:MAG: PaaI family thioesterase [Pseudomonadota bacterium]